MKVIFTFTDSPNLEGLSKDDIYNTFLEIPDEAQHLIGYEQRILAIAEAVGQLTGAALHITCKELSLKNHPVKTKIESHRSPADTLFHSINTLVLYFERLGGRKAQQRRQFKIYAPVSLPLPQWFLGHHGKKGRDRKNLRKNLIQLRFITPTTDSEKEAFQSLSTITDQLLVLMNADPANSVLGAWSCSGFHPFWIDNALIDRHNKRGKRQAAEARKRQREEEKQKALEAKMALKPVSSTQSPGTKTGAGRRPGAIPGVFKGVQFRSQLEIRFATELESRGIHWEYEIERLGEGQYLVDFYLPDYACWVEVKGRFEPRDEYLLKDVAVQLMRERNQMLFVYMQSKCYEVQPTVFQEMKRDDFWAKVATLFRQP